LSFSFDSAKRLGESLSQKVKSPIVSGTANPSECLFDAET